jgi:hypothetical protein
MKKAEIYLFGGLFLLYFLTSSAGFESGDAVTRYETAKSILEGRGGALPSGLPLNNLAIAADGRLFGAYHPLQSFLLMIPIALLKLFGLTESAVDSGVRVVFNLLFLPMLSVGSLVAMFFALKNFGIRTATARWGVLLVGVATPFWHYARCAQEENLVSFGMAIWMLGASRLELQRRGNLLLMSAGISWAFLARAAAVAPLFVLGLVSIWLWNKQSRPLSWEFWVGILIFVLSLLGILFYNHYRFGSVFESGYALALAPVGLSVFSFTEVVPRLWALLLSPYRGLLLYAPVILLFPVAMAKDRSWWMWVGVFCLGACLTLNGIYSFWAAGHSWGPRFLISPFILFAPVLARLSEISFRPGLKAAVVLVLVLSVSVQVLSTLYPSSLEDQLRDSVRIEHLDPANSWLFEYSPFYVRPAALLGRDYPEAATLFWWPFRFSRLVRPRS